MLPGKRRYAMLTKKLSLIDILQEIEALNLGQVYLVQHTRSVYLDNDRKMYRKLHPELVTT